MKYFVEIYEGRHAGRRYEVAAGEATIGNSAGDIVRLSGGGIAGPAALKMKVSAAGVELHARDSAAKFSWQGESRSEALIPWGGEVFLGHCRLAFIHTERGKSGSSPVVPVLVATMVVLAISLLVKMGRSEVSATAPAEPPPLTELEDSTCPKEKATAAAWGNHLLAQARANVERYPFSRRDGIEALTRYTAAEACFKLGGQDISSTTEEREKIQKRLNRDYRDLRLRLELALRKKDYDSARLAAKGLNELFRARFESPKGDYDKWVSKTLARLEARAEKAHR